jgi:hypothetical protein
MLESGKSFSLLPPKKTKKNEKNKVLHKIEFLEIKGPVT